MQNRVGNVGYAARRPFMNAAMSVELRAAINEQIDRQIEQWYRAGVSREKFMATELYLSTKLLRGYFSYLLNHEGPLGVVAYSYLVEYANVKLEPAKLAALKEPVGESSNGGQISHSHTDINDDHPGQVWAAIRSLVRGEQDIEALKKYLEEHQRILARYFNELYHDTIPQAEMTRQVNRETAEAPGQASSFSATSASPSWRTCSRRSARGTSKA
jgi:hypothetical protein